MKAKAADVDGLYRYERLSLYFDSGIYHSFCLNGLRSGSEGKDTLLELEDGREQKKVTHSSRKKAK